LFYFIAPRSCFSNIASHTGVQSPTSKIHVGDSSSTSSSHVEYQHPISASHAGEKHPTSTSHVGGEIPVTASHTGNRSIASMSHVIDQSPTSISHVSDMSTTSTGHVGDKKSATTNHVGGIDSFQKPIWIGCKPKFPCNLCKGDHLNHLFPNLPEVRILWSLSARYFDSESSKLPSHSIQPLVNEVIILMKSSVDATSRLGGDVPVDHFVS
jgi:hypothetical protein